MPEEINNPKSKFLITLIISCILCISAMFYIFYYKQDFQFIVETSCDPTSQTCFYRDCSLLETECPPNNYSYYKSYNINAADFKYCSNEDCKNVCESGSIQCEENQCTEDDINTGVCTVPVIETSPIETEI